MISLSLAGAVVCWALPDSGVENTASAITAAHAMIPKGFLSKT
jgi:hypothetical protein